MSLFNLPNQNFLTNRFLRFLFLGFIALCCFGTEQSFAQSGGALNFTNGDYVELPAAFNSVTSGTTDFTIETWFKTSMSDGTMLAKRSICNVSAFWNLRITAGKVRFEMMGTGGANAADISTTLNYNDNTWHHVAVTRGSNLVRLYIDGYLVGTANTSIATNLSNSSDPIKLGQSACNNFIGLLDETRIWTVLRTDCEIYENMNYEFNSSSTNLKFNAHYNQGTAAGSNSTVNTLTNSASNGIAANLVSFALSGTTSNWVTSSCPAQGLTSTPPHLVTVSSCGSYVWQNITYPVSGSYTRTFTTAQGCDSVAQLNLTVNSFPTPSISVLDANVCSGSNGSMLVTNTATPSYCTPTTTNTTANNDFISWFTFVGISNLTTDGPGVYNHYTNTIALVTAGSSYSYSIFLGGSNAQGTAIWIDYNQDGDFNDAGEYVVNTASNIFGPAGNLTISSSAKNGLTRLRVACRRGATPASNQSCGGYDYGEFEDYNLIISGGQPDPNTYSWTPTTFLTGTSSINPTFNNITSSTTYTATLTDANGCSATATQTITVNPLPTTPIISSSSASYCSGTTLTLNNQPNYCTPTVSGSNITGQHYITSFSLGSGLINNTTGDGPGVYNFYLNTTAALTAGTPYAYSIIPGGSISTSKGIWVDLNQDGDFSDAGELIATAPSSTSGVSSSFVIPVSAYNGTTRMRVAVSANTTITSSQSCTGFTFGEYEDYLIQISGGFNALSWAPATPLNATSGNPVQIINQTANTIYTLTVTDANGCSSSDTHTINYAPSPNVTITASADSICAGLPVTLSGNGAVSYSWSPSITSGVAFVPNATTTYTVTGTAANGCTKTNTKEVKVLSLPSQPIINGPTNAVCAGSQVMLSTVAYCTPVNLPSNIYSNAYSISHLYFGSPINNNSFTYVDINNEINTNSVYSNFTNQVANVTAGGAYGIAIFPEGSQPVYFLVLIDYNQDGVFDVFGNEVVYTVQTPVSNPQGVNFYIPSNAKNGLTRMRVLVSSHNFNYDVACANHDPNGSAQVYGEYEDYSIKVTGGIPANLIWTPSQAIINGQGANALATIYSTTTYTVTNTESNGCSSSGTYVVNMAPTPTVNITVSAPGICIGNSVTLTATGASNYSWSNNVSNGVAFSPTATATYSVVGTNSAGCKDTATIQIPVDNIPSIPTITTSSTCVGQSASMQLSKSYCIPIVAANLSGKHYINSFTFNSNAIHNVTGEEPNNYTYFSNLTANVIAGSVNYFTIGIGGPLQNIATIYVDYNQDGDFDDANELAWSGTNIANSFNDSITIPFNALNGTTRMRVLCYYSTLGYSSLTCEGVIYGEYEDYNLNISGSSTAATTYTWSPSNLLVSPTGNVVTTTPLSANTTYTITASSTYGCTSTATTTVMVNPLPIVTATSNVSGICLGDTAQLGLIPIPASNSTVQWSPAQGLSNPTIANPMASPNTGILYMVNVVDSNGCTGSSAILLDVHNIPNAVNITGPSSICAGSPATLTASGASSYTWQPGNLTGTSVTVNPTQATTYTVTAANTFGCTKTNTVLLNVHPLPAPLVIASSDTLCAGSSASLASYTFSDMGPAVTIQDFAQANPYPATIQVSGLPSSNAVLHRVHINGLTHTWPEDIDMWLKSPNGQIVMLMSDVGGSSSIVNTNIIFQDGQASMSSGQIQNNGIYSPTNLNVNFPNEPLNPSTQLSDFNGNVNGTWELYIRDDVFGDSGNLLSFQLEFGIGDANDYTIAWVANPSTNQGSISNPNSFSPILTPLSSTIYTATVTDAFGCIGTTSLSIIVTPCNTNLSLKLFIEGYYIGASTMASVLLNEGVSTNNLLADSILVELRNASAPYSLVASTNTVLHTDGSASATFSGVVANGNYYIVIKHRNSIETWSASPISISTSTTSTYDFSTSANQAYGSNQKEVENGLWALYSGDINRDGAIDAFDYLLQAPDIVSGASGYLNTDLNGDGAVDAFDYLIIAPNITEGVGVAAP